MNNAKKLTAVAIAAAIAVSCAGCADQSWSYKADEDVSISAGAYIYNLLNGYYEAYDKVESPDEVKDILKAEVTDSDEGAETKTVEQYAYDKADETSQKMVVIESLFRATVLSLTKQRTKLQKATLRRFGLPQRILLRSTASQRKASTTATPITT